MSQPDRSKLPIRKAPFKGVANRTLDGSQPDWEELGHVEAPEGAPNVLLVLIDDAGFGNPSTFGGPIDTPNYTRIAAGGLRYNRFHVDGAVLADAGGTADRPQQPRGRVSARSVSSPAAFPGYSATVPRRLRAVPADSAGQRVQHGGVRQVASDAGRPAGRRRAVRPLAGRLGLRLLLRVPRRGLVAVGPVPGREPEDHRHARGVLRRGGPVLPAGCDGGQDDRVAARDPGAGRQEAVLRLLLHRLQPRPAPCGAGSGRRSTRASSTRAGTSCARRRSRGRRRWA